MSDEWSSFPATGNKIVPIIAFDRGFRVELPQRSQKMLEILPSDGRIFHMDGSLCEGRVNVFHLYKHKRTGNVTRWKIHIISYWVLDLKKIGGSISLVYCGSTRLCT
jgi:hypothetical protein